MRIMTNKELQNVVHELIGRVEELEKRTLGLNKALYSVQEVAEILGVTREAVYCMIKRGELPAIKFGTTKIRAVDIAEVMGYGV